MTTAYYYLGSAVIIIQLLCVALVLRNCNFSLKKYQKIRKWFPKTVLIIPCKGLDIGFEKNITSFFKQDFENFLLWFVVESQDDPAYQKLNELKEKLSSKSRALEIKILVAGIGQECSQKIHNLLYGYSQISDDIEMLAFADSDIDVRTDWLSHLIFPLRHDDVGVSSGYRWFVPKKNNLATLAMSAGNAKVAQLLGNSIFNQAWGGSMAVRAEVFRELDMEKIWQTALSDDLSLSETAKRAGYKVEYVPACLAASYEDTDWANAFEFVRRQFLITKVFSFGTWLFSIITTAASVFSTWGTTAIAIFASTQKYPHQWFYITVLAAALLSQFSRASIRQYVAVKLLSKDKQNMKYAIAADMILFWAWSMMLFILVASTTFGRTITWRGIRYKMLSQNKTIILKD